MRQNMTERRLQRNAGKAGKGINEGAKQQEWPMPATGS